MTCPKCGAKFEEIKHDQIEGLRCTQCSGLWFESVIEPAEISGDAALEVDQGDPHIGKIYDLISNVNCPTCKTKLVSVEDPDQEHIQYEICGTCYGVFFDAGEFSDFIVKAENLAKIRDLLWER